MYRIDETTGHAELLVTLAIVLPVTGGISPITGLAFDPDTGRPIGSSGNERGRGGPGLPRLYDINLSTGPAGWLNETPPDLSGIATVMASPEPGAGTPVLAGLAAWGFFAKIRTP